MTAYYNEIDPFAADVLENLILCGVIPAGHVDRRSIEDVQSSDLKGYTQCHFFAGFGVWPYAMRQAGWPDDRPAWTGSCPCPPFSTAGKKKACPECDGQRPIPHVGRTGYFVCCLCGHEWLADGRHLWPEFWRLIRDERPPVVLGEQVAGADGLVWIDLVRASLEIMAYATGAADLCAAGVGAPHIRQRTYWVAHPDDKRSFSGSLIGIHSGESSARARHGQSERSGSTCVVGNAHDARSQRWCGPQCGCIGENGQTATCGPSCELEHAHCERCGETRETIPGQRVARGCADGPLADNQLQQRSFTASDCNDAGRRDEEPTALAGFRSDMRPAPLNGFWADADWLGCTDGKWRPVEPGTFPLVNGAPNRVGGLRGYGNAIVAPLAQEFVETVMEYLGHDGDAR